MGRRDPPDAGDAGHFRALIEHASDLMLEFGLDRRVEFVSPSVERLLGYATDEVRGREIVEFLDPAEIPRIREIIETPLADPSGPRSVEHRLRRKDGSWGVFETRGQATSDARGRVRVVSISRDISERRRAEETHARLSLAVEQAAELIVITDPGGNIQYVNPAFERVTGYRPEQVLGQNPRILKSGLQDANFYRELWQTLARQEVWRGSFSNRRRDGGIYQVEATISPVHLPGGELMGYVAVERDVTHEKRLEQQLLQAQKMEAIGRLAGGIAHDFNNLLGVITGYGELLLRSLPKEGPHPGRVEQMLRAAERAAALTRQLVAFSRRQVLQPKVLDLNLVVDDTDQMLRRLIGEDIALVTVRGDDLGCVKADPGQIEQVLMNLAVNARDAMPHGGRLTVETRNLDLSQTYAQEHVMEPGRYVMLAVTDTGCGMDAETLGHAFEPFFTTKEIGKGTGLGLSTVYGIVKQSGGYVFAYSEPGRGSSFKVYLPRVDETADVATRIATRVPPPRGSETILLLEDDPLLRDLLAETLTSSGHRVLTARNGAEALAMAERHGPGIALLVSDVVLPGMSGREAADRLRLGHPSMRVLFVSGYADDAVIRHGELPAGAAFLSKPFSPDALLHKVREVLTGSAWAQ